MQLLAKPTKQHVRELHEQYSNDLNIQIYLEQIIRLASVATVKTVVLKDGSLEISYDEPFDNRINQIKKELHAFACKEYPELFKNH